MGRIIDTYPAGYTSVSDLAVYMDTTFTSGSTDETAAIRAIVWAEAVIDKYCGRTFVVTSETKKYDGRGRTEMPVDDILSLTSVVIDSTTIDSGYYYLYPYSRYPKRKIKANGYLFTDGFQNVEVAGLWGYQESLPTTGTADSGTTTTLVDSPLTQVNDWWNGYVLSVTGGTNVGYSRSVSDFVLSTKTITVAHAFPVAIDATSVYALGRIPAGVALAANRLAAVYLRSRTSPGNQNILSESQGDYSVTYGSTLSLDFIDREAALYLADYVCPGFGGRGL